MNFANYLPKQHRIAYATVGAGLATGLAWYFKNKLEYQRSKQLPTEWEEVGTVSELLIYPLKSASAIPVQTATATQDGLKEGFLLDRSFMVLTEDHNMVTARQTSELLMLKTSFKDKTLTLASKNGESISVNTDAVNKENKIIKFRMRGDPLQGLDCGDEVAEWLSNQLFHDGTRVRLIYKGPDRWPRPPRLFKYFKFPNFNNNDTTLYNDGTAYNIATEASLNDLNDKLETPVTMAYFRPPIIVAGTKPFDEDTWEYIKIGNEAILHTSKPCERCNLTKINPTTGEKRDDHFEKLKSYRVPSYPEALVKAWASSPVFGLHCGIDVTGDIKVGDKVCVSRVRTPYWYV